MACNALLSGALFSVVNKTMQVNELWNYEVISVVSIPHQEVIPFLKTETGFVCLSIVLNNKDNY